MLKSVIGIAAGAALAFAVGARPARAMDDETVLEAHVPFAFEVEGHTMPAGNYEIKAAGFYEPEVVEIRSADLNGPQGFFLTVPSEVGTDLQHAKLVFDRIGNQRFLRAILIPGEAGARLPVDRAEVQAARAESGLSTPSRS